MGCLSGSREEVERAAVSRPAPLRPPARGGGKGEEFLRRHLVRGVGADRLTRFDLEHVLADPRRRLRRGLPGWPARSYTRRRGTARPRSPISRPRRTARSCQSWTVPVSRSLSGAPPSVCTTSPYLCQRSRLPQAVAAGDRGAPGAHAGAVDGPLCAPPRPPAPGRHRSRRRGGEERASLVPHPSATPSAARRPGRHTPSLPPFRGARRQPRTDIVSTAGTRSRRCRPSLSSVSPAGPAAGTPAEEDTSRPRPCAPRLPR
jgi:hypothetical protein